MENFTSWSELFLSALRDIWTQFIEALPTLLGAVVIFLLGWLAAKIFSKIILKILMLVKFDDLAEKVDASAILEKANINNAPSFIVSKLFYWLILLLVFLTASETLGWQSFSNEISKLISYLPKLFLALILFIVGSYLATLIRDILSGTSESLGISTGKVLSGFVYYVIIIISSLTALEQAGVDTSFISSNMLLILGAILISMSVSYAFASKDVMTNILSAYISRNRYREGMIVSVINYTGEVLSMDSSGLCLLIENEEKVIIPASILQKEEVRIIRDIETL